MKNYNIDELIKLILQNINKKNFEEALNIINNSPIIDSVSLYISIVSLLLGAVSRVIVSVPTEYSVVKSVPFLRTFTSSFF